MPFPPSLQDLQNWNTDAFDAGGGVAPNLAQVLAEGGDPDGNPITGAVTISPTAAVSGLTVKNSSAATTFESDDTGLGFFGTAPAAQPSVNLSGNTQVDVDNLIAALVSLGLITTV